MKAPAIVVVPVQAEPDRDDAAWPPAATPERCGYRPSNRRHLVGIGGALAMTALMGATCTLLWSQIEYRRERLSPPITVVRIAAAPAPKPAAPEPPAASRPKAVPRISRIAAVPAPRIVLAAPTPVASAPFAPPQFSPAMLSPAPVPPPVANTAPSPATTTPSTARTAPDTGWQSRLMARLATCRRYPAEARHRHEQGTASVRFRMDREGRVLWAQLAQSSGSALLDAAAIDTVNRAAPLPKLPPAMGDELTLTLPIAFSLH